MIIRMVYGNNLLKMPLTEVSSAVSLSAMQSASAKRSLVPISTTATLGIWVPGICPCSSLHHRCPIWSPAQCTPHLLRQCRLSAYNGRCGGAKRASTRSHMLRRMPFATVHAKLHAAFLP